MAAKLLSAFIVLLLVTGAVAGICPDCSRTTPEKTSDCCQHHSGDCQVPTPKDCGNTCPHVALAPALDHPTQLHVSSIVAPPVTAPAIVQPAPAEPPLAPAPRGAIVHSPPDLYLLDATLLV